WTRLAPPPLPDRLRACALGALAGGAPHHSSNAERWAALRLPAPGGLRRPASDGDAVSHRLPHGREAAGLGGGHAGAAAPAPARARPGPGAEHARDDCTV